MADLDATYSAFAAERGLEALPSFAAGPLTPLLVESGSGQLSPAARGPLGDGVEGTVGQLAYTRNKTFRFNVALTEIAAATAFAPRVWRFLSAVRGLINPLLDRRMDRDARIAAIVAEVETAAKQGSD